jgi:hypothetical protein
MCSARVPVRRSRLAPARWLVAPVPLLAKLSAPGRADQLLQRAHVEVPLRHGEAERHEDRRRDVGEILLGVVGHARIERLRDDHRGDRRMHEAVAVRRRLRDVVGADEATAADAVLDDDGHAQHLAQLGREDPHHDVGRAAGTERHDEADRPVRPGPLRMHGRRGERPGGAEQQGPAADQTGSLRHDDCTFSSRRRVQPDTGVLVLIITRPPCAAAIAAGRRRFSARRPRPPPRRCPPPGSPPSACASRSSASG